MEHERGIMTSLHNRIFTHNKMKKNRMNTKKTGREWLCALFCLLSSNAPLLGAESDGFHREVAREIAYEGSVLLENRNGTLPLPGGCRLALFGINQTDCVKGGGGSADSRVPYVRQLLEGLEEKEKEGKLSLFAPLADFYRQSRLDGYRNGHEPEVPGELLRQAREASDVALLAIGRFSREGDDCSPGPGGYELSPSEVNLLRAVTGAGFAKVVVVLNTGNVIDSSWYKDNASINAVLLSWQAGMEAGQAVADLLTGDAYPSGKLTDTLAKSYADYPSAALFGASPHYQDYLEDIYMGYRYFETLAPGRVNYEFGYGLGYTDFAIDDTEACRQGEEIVVRCRVSNTGHRPGKEVVQVYFSAPQGKLGRPAKELAAFVKTEELAPGGSERVELRFPLTQMAAYDDLGHVCASAYVLEEGEYRFFVGNSVRQVQETAYRYRQERPATVRQLSRKAAPKRLEYRLRADGSYERLPLLQHDVPYRQATHVEMEDCSASDPEVQTRDFYHPYGRRFQSLANFNEAGRWAEYQLEVAQADSYCFTWRVCNPGKRYPDAFQVFLDGKEQKGVVVDLPATLHSTDGEWNDYVWAEPFRLHLPAGHHTLRFVSRYAHEGRLDRMLVESAGRRDSLLQRPVTKPDGKIIRLEEAEKNPKLTERFLGQIPLRDLFALATGTRQKAPFVRTESLGDKAEYGIPNLHTSDGPSGVYVWAETTGYPISTMLACTWNKALCQKLGEAMAEECQHYGIDLLLAPGINLHRNPLCGRNFEYYSEDPYLAGKMAAAFIGSVQEKGVGVSLKHFAANNCERNRHGSDSRMSERALRELYLRGFEIAVRESDPWSIMASYNPVNGVKATENADLLSGILRDEWGYGGTVISDWDTTGLHALEAKAGTDVKMPFGCPEELRAALDNGLLTRAELERNLERLLRMALKSQAYRQMKHGEKK